MLAKIAKEHQTQQQELRTHNELLRNEATKAAGNLSDALTDVLYANPSSVFHNQREIESETKKLQASIAKYQKQTQQWIDLVAPFNNSLKELGDIQNWAKTIETDTSVILGTYAQIQAKPRPAGGQK
ncbi:biogenesis of lysosome-related organelles complex 1 subunit 1-like protein [Polychytrium aggregatum]|uniref:biogenesis of lysosome-related organelles complex 1 subunit 1-like protein n=1 Tax=Polychytrium aggregatum TaxID=110093 RepID=UPI0022FF2268|nr:biogenesis of lysosome-related organelles complex 1 subunit 1-like protein [Polychytrium aggregatum]KAI9193222.1 biogenesis of lysosome-related organelles complex 1 subunit 1-like protein [Polychytrium aggregatum]